MDAAPPGKRPNAVSQCPSTSLMCPPQDTEKPQVMLLGSDDNLGSPSDSGNRCNSSLHCLNQF